MSADGHKTTSTTLHSSYSEVHRLTDNHAQRPNIK